MITVHPKFLEEKETLRQKLLTQSSVRTEEKIVALLFELEGYWVSHTPEINDEDTCPCCRTTEYWTIFREMEN